MARNNRVVVLHPGQLFDQRVTDFHRRLLFLLVRAESLSRTRFTDDDSRTRCYWTRPRLCPLFVKIDGTTGDASPWLCSALFPALESARSDPEFVGRPQIKRHPLG